MIDMASMHTMKRIMVENCSNIDAARNQDKSEPKKIFVVDVKEC